MRRRNRPAIALIACALWLLGVEALPGVHLASHADDHTHAPDGSIRHRGEHRHGEVVHSHAKRQAKQRSQLAFDLAPSGHEASGLAHHAIAYSHAAAPLLAPLPVDQPSRLVEHAPSSVAHSSSLPRPHARGPPA